MPADRPHCDGPVAYRRAVLATLVTSVKLVVGVPQIVPKSTPRRSSALRPSFSAPTTCFDASSTNCRTRCSGCCVDKPSPLSISVIRGAATRSQGTQHELWSFGELCSREMSRFDSSVTAVVHSKLCTVERFHFLLFFCYLVEIEVKSACHTRAA